MSHIARSLLGFYSAELDRLMRERITETGDHLAYDPDPWLLTVADKAGEEALAQMEADSNGSLSATAKRRRGSGPRTS